MATKTLLSETPHVVSTKEQDDLSGYKETTLAYAVRFIPRVLFRSLQYFNRTKYNYFSDHPAFAPVKTEIFSESLEVEGTIPADLNGAYIRTGPNPQYKPWGGYHWFDGEGMTHSVYFSGGKAKSYSNHWLRCYRYLTEKASGCNLFLRFGDVRGAFGLLIMFLYKGLARLRLLCPTPPGGDLVSGQLGNTALAFHGGKLLALMEGGLPFLLRLCAGAVRSVGAFSYSGHLSHAMTAHPKVDAQSGEMACFTYQLQKTKENPHLAVYFTVSPSGAVSKDYPVSISRPQMMHDFAITAKFAVFMDHALVFNPAEMVKRGGAPFVCDKSRPARVGLMDRSAPEHGVRWFEAPAFVCFHTATAWDDGEKVHLVLSKYDNVQLGLLYGFEKYPSFATRLTIDTQAGTVTETVLSSEYDLEFPVVPLATIGRAAPTRYCYMVGHRTGSKEGRTCLCKIDMAAEAGEGLAGVIEHGLFGNEFSFAPRAAAAADDDGYLVGYATDVKTEVSYCLVYDAKTMASTPVAKVTMPQRVPLGFHGLWVAQEQIDSQEPSARSGAPGALQAES